MWRALSFIAFSSALCQTGPDYTVEKMLGGQRFVAAVAWSKDGYLLVADLPTGKISKVDGDGPSVFLEKIHAAGIAWDSDGRMYLCDPHERRVTRTDKKGKIEILAERFEGKRLNGPASIAVSARNQIWFADPSYATADKQKELPFYGVYHLTPKGELSAAIRMAGRPAGIAISTDNKTLYVSDADARAIFAWDLDKNGNPSNQRVFAKIAEGVPAGLLAAPDGKLYVAAKSIQIFTQSGEPAGKIEIAEKPSVMTLGDAELGTLYVGARTSVYRVRLKAQRVRRAPPTEAMNASRGTPFCASSTKGGKT